jgi:hypothetical protein
MREKVVREQIFREKVAAEPEPLFQERDLNKQDLRNRTAIGDPVQRASEAAAEFFGGIAEAFSKAFRSFGSEIDTNNVTKVGMSNGFIAGSVAANANFFAELSRTSERVYDTLKSDEEQISRGVEPIDYDRLAKLVAAEILRAQVLTQDTEVPPAAGVEREVETARVIITET